MRGGYVLETQMTYKWTVPVYPVDAQKAGTELEKITEKHGLLTPEHVVIESKNKKAVLHKCFEWNNEIAAEKYRFRQAQDLIRNIVTVKIGQVETTQPIRAFVSFKQNKEYVSVINVLYTPELQKKMMDSAMKELETFQKKYASLNSLSELMLSIDSSLEKYKNENSS